MAKTFKVDINGLKEFSQKLKAAADGDLIKQYNLWLEAAGMEFLDIVQDEIIRLKVVDTRRLLNSFTRSDSDCIFKLTGKGLKLEIGTNIEYAQWVNDGHYIGSKKLTIKTKNGRKLALRNIKNWVGKRKWIEGYHYFDISLEVFEKILVTSMEKKLQEWLDEF
ncbi:HK97 gp10 family phage protein [Sporomusa sp.]|uniref:HK97 gp10 family phage protein n=1 Tax=Sporomusa sp. TaxID=2078658 RepID=UPI002CD47519|nr:HK97 gp10 family phage protein [Sporomusa sp.]HWR07103.1 HK97 gp10 family phage protein [Sporomusa sp.]